MPRGDGRDPGERRTSRKRVSLPKYIPKWLARRQEWWDNFGKTSGERVTQVSEKLKYTSYDGICDYRKPGSQRKR